MEAAITDHQRTGSAGDGGRGARLRGEGRPLLGAAIALAGTLLLARDASPVGAQAPPAQEPLVSVRRICSTERGWCPIPLHYPPGRPCYCLVPPNTQLPGIVRECSWKPPANLYLNPHRPCL